MPYISAFYANLIFIIYIELTLYCFLNGLFFKFVISLVFIIPFRSRFGLEIKRECRANRQQFPLL